MTVVNLNLKTLFQVWGRSPARAGLENLRHRRPGVQRKRFCLSSFTFANGSKKNVLQRHGERQWLRLYRFAGGVIMCLGMLPQVSTECWKFQNSHLIFQRSKCFAWSHIQSLRLLAFQLHHACEQERDRRILPLPVPVPLRPHLHRNLRTGLKKRFENIISSRFQYKIRVWGWLGFRISKLGFRV